MGGQVPQGRTDGTPGGVHAGDEHQRSDTQDHAPLHRCTVEFAVQQVAQQVVAGLGRPLLHLGPEIPDERLGAVLAALGVVGELEHVPHPSGEGVRQLGWDPEDGGDHPHRDLLGVPGGGVGGALIGEPGHQVGTEAAGQGFVALHPAVGEPRQQQAPGPGVEGRVRRDGREPVGEDRFVTGSALEGDDRDLLRAEVVDVVGQVHHVAVPGREPGAPPAVGVGHRAGTA